MSLPIDHLAVWRALESYYPDDSSMTWTITPCAYGKLLKEWRCNFVGLIVEFENPANETAFLLRYS